MPEMVFACVKTQPSDYSKDLPQNKDPEIDLHFMKIQCKRVG